METASFTNPWLSRYKGIEGDMVNLVGTRMWIALVYVVPESMQSVSQSDRDLLSAA